MPQKRISTWTSWSDGSRREMVVEANGDVGLETEYAFALYMEKTSELLGSNLRLREMEVKAVSRFCQFLA